MKRKDLLMAMPMVFALLLLAVSLSGAAKTQKGEYTLMQDLQAAGVTLKAGKYLVVHREHEAAEGKACLFFYHPATASEKNEVAKFRCKPVESKPMQGFTARESLQPDGKVILQSVQFAGSNEIHQLESAN
ncbi:MAG: hypothetical protein HY648_08530 [Acidobacteria bacterium]|nr:hypothetical protein [Acidobacteriota bacterium]